MRPPWPPENLCCVGLSRAFRPLSSAAIRGLSFVDVIVQILDLVVLFEAECEALIHADIHIYTQRHTSTQIHAQTYTVTHT